MKAEAQALIKQLAHPEPNMRLKACQDLAKMGDPAVIPALVKVYRNTNEDKKVKAAAGKAIKQYAKNAPKRAPGRGLRIAMGMMTVSLIALIAANLLLGGGDDNGETDSTDNTPTEDVQVVYTELLANARADLVAMQTEWTSNPLPCTATLNRAQPRPLTEEPPSERFDEFVVVPLNDALERLINVATLWDSACAAGGVPPEADLANVNTQLFQIEVLTLGAETELNAATQGE